MRVFFKENLPINRNSQPTAMSSSSARIEEVPEEEDDAAYMVEVDQVYLIHQSNYVRAKCENGSIVLPKESFVEN